MEGLNRTCIDSLSGGVYISMVFKLRNRKLSLTTSLLWPIALRVRPLLRRAHLACIPHTGHLFCLFCAGCMGDPGHPHLHPHFVFSQPLTEESMHGDHAAASREQHHATSGDDQDVIAGESTPSIGALSMLALVVTSLSQQTFLLPVGCEYAPPVQFPPGLLVHVATPPPRCAPL